MKNYRIFLLLLLPVLLLDACKKKDDGPSLDMVLEPVSFVIPAGANAFETIHFLVKDRPTHFFEILDAAGIKPEQVTGMAGATATFEADFADAQYKYLYDVSIRVYKEPDSDDFVEAFYREPIPDNAGNTLGLIPSLANLDGFLKTDIVSFDIAILPRVTTPESIPTRLFMSYKIRL